MEKTCILVVDVAESMRFILEEFLRSRGYNVVTAQNGRDALVAMDLVAVDLILTDLEMPVMNGWEFARALDLRGSQIPVVVMTAGDSATEMTRAMNAAAYLRKPFPLETLASTINAVMRLAHASMDSPS